MPNIRNISSEQILRFLIKQGFEIHHQKGSHVQLRKEELLHVTVPSHGNRILKIGTVLSVLRQAGIDKSFFLENC